jgi:hypothetical protein
MDPIGHMANRDAFEKFQNLYNSQQMNFAGRLNENNEEELRNRMRTDGVSKIEEGETIVKDEEFFDMPNRYKINVNEGVEQKEEHQEIPQMYFQMRGELKEEENLPPEQIQRDDVKVEEFSNKDHFQPGEERIYQPEGQTDMKGYKKLKKKVKKH